MFDEIILVCLGYEAEFKNNRTQVFNLALHHNDLIVNENWYAGFLLKSMQVIDVSTIKLVLGEHEFDLIDYERLDGYNYYGIDFNNLFPEDTEFWARISIPIKVSLPKLFLNNIGIVRISLWDTNNDTNTELCELEIVSDKINENDLNELFDYLHRKDISYWNPFSMVSLFNDDQFLRKSFFLLLQQLELDLREIRKRIHEFQSSPVSILQPNYSLNKFDGSKMMDDNSMQWLFSNLDVLRRSGNGRTSDSIKIKNQFFNVDQILIKSYDENVDIYENQIIAGFIIDVREVLSIHHVNILAKIEKLEYEIKVLDLISIVKVQEKKFFERQVKLISELLSLTIEIQNYFSEYIPVRFPISSPPKSDNKFQSKEHYSIIYIIISRWYEFKDSSWGTNELFGGIRTLDKLYELFCLFKLIDYIKLMGFKQINTSLESDNTDLWGPSQHIGVYDFVSNDNPQKFISLHYEKLPEDLCTIIPTKKGRPLCPDFIVEYRTLNTTRYLILDSKFKKIRNIRKFTFADIIPKYIHGIGKKDGSMTNLAGLVILFPEDRSDNKSHLDFHKGDYRFGGNKQAKPYICATEIAFDGSRGNAIRNILLDILKD